MDLDSLQSKPAPNLTCTLTNIDDLSGAFSAGPWSNSNCREGRVALVHLFEWKWTDIANECETFLGPMGYCGVQLSPPMEHVLITLPESDRPWWERYQPVSYKLDSRSGSEAQLRDMVTRCNNAGINIYADAVINHMAGMDRSGIGSAGSSFSTMNENPSFPGVPFTASDFNGCENCGGCCCINAWQDHAMVRNCRLLGLADLKMSDLSVRQKVANYMNALIDMGMAGFRVDAAKHMWPGDLEAVWGMLNDLNTQWFPGGSKPFMALEVIDLNQQGEVSVHEYTYQGRVTEFRYCVKVNNAQGALWDVFNLYDPGWGMVAGNDAFVFVDNHDNQRGHGAGEALTHQHPREYKIAQAITLSQTYGWPRVMSSYYFSNGDQGPPNSGSPNYITNDVVINADGSCGNGWVCEHRWQPVAGMASFAKATSSVWSMDNRWQSGNQIAFSRGDKGFVVFTNHGGLNERMYTGLPEGIYCNVIKDCPDTSGCGAFGQEVYVAGNGMADIVIDNGNEPIFAIHVEAMKGSNGCTGEGEGSPGPVPTIVPTTPGPTTPPPAGMQRTVVYLKLVTIVGQDVFVRGGIDHQHRLDCTTTASTSDCAISIVHQSQGTSSHYDKYNAWRVNDNYLDWYGSEPGQGSYDMMTPDGSPLAWTTSNSGSSGYQPDNQWGDHYWRMEFLMDCDKTEEGWFEMKGYVTNGQGWEDDINQYTTCSGTAGGTRPYITGNHMGRCGYLNVFEFNLGTCTINNL